MANEIRTQAWPEILKFLGGIAGFAPLQDFIRQVSASPHAAGLHAYTSLRTVAIARTVDVQQGQERLMVCFDPKHGRIHMAYTDWGAWDVGGPTPTIRGKDSWIRDYAPEEAMPAFLKFLRRAGWVPDADRA